MSARPRTIAGVLAGASLTALLLVAACSESPKLVGEGGACAVTADCVKGLVCVPQKAGRTCTSDLSAIDTTPQRPSDAGRDADGSRDGRADASDAIASDAPVEPPPDSGQPPPDASE